jgi:hypothetical protein
MMWTGAKNGRLLELAAKEKFDALLSLDSGIPYQHNLSTLPCSVIILHSKSNKISDLQPLLTELRDCLASLSPNNIAHIGGLDLP